MRMPIRLIEGRWPGRLQRALARFCWVDPRVVLDDTTPPETFSRAMAAFHTGSTVKITGAGRHRGPDDVLLRHVDLRGLVVADIGASDGTTSVELLRELPDVRQFVIADLFLEATAVDLGAVTVFHDQSGRAVLVVGRRLVAWPQLSAGVRLLYRPVLSRARAVLDGRRPGAARRVLLLNPQTRALLRTDPRVTCRRHNVFEPWTGPRPDVVKVANVLRRLYFSDEQILAGIEALLAVLPDGGHLLMVDNPRVSPAPPARGGLYRRDGDRFTLVAQTDAPCEIDDLVRAARLLAGTVPSEGIRP